MLLLLRLFYLGLISLGGLFHELGLKELTLESIHVLKNYNQAFDLSGIAKIEQDYYVVSDNQFSKQLYQIQLSPSSFHISDSISLQYDAVSDIEAIDYCEDRSVFFTNEVNNHVYLFADGQNKKVFDSSQLTKYLALDWGTNKGLEGIAVDCKNQILYLAKERDPRFILAYDLRSDEIISMAQRDNVGDISDLKYQDGYLYVLERKDNIISKMDVKTMQVVQRVSYKKTCSHPDGKLYSGTPYGMAEALLLTHNEIWIGLDNNGLPFSEHATKTYGLTGKNPLLLRFKRPEGF
jgi:uncharacterized protein YjiK